MIIELDGLDFSIVEDQMVWQCYQDRDFEEHLKDGFLKAQIAQRPQIIKPERTPEERFEEYITFINLD